MSLSIRNKKTQILLLSFAFTFIIFALNKKSNKSLPNAPFNLRILLSSEDVNIRCEKAPKNFLNQYNVSEIPTEDPEELSEHQKVLKNIIHNKEYNFNSIKKYIPRILIFFIFLIVDILFIIMWFVFCGCCCCCGKKTNAGGCAKCLFFLFCFFSAISILICVVGFIISPSIYKSINGVMCSLYKLVFHFIEGTKDEISFSDWKGLEGINDLILKYESTHNKTNKLPNKEFYGEDCSGQDDPYCKAYEEIIGKLKSNNDISTNLEKMKVQITSISSKFSDIKDNTLDSVEKIMEFIDCYYKLGMIILFAAIAAMCLLGILSLTPYFCCNYSCISCLYHLFWNIEMLVIIITLLIGVCLGIVGIVFKDAVPLLNYAKSSDNLGSDNPFLLDLDKDNRDKINICFNGNGDLSTLIGEDLQSKDINEYSSNFKTQYKELKNESPQRENLVKAYDQLNVIINELVELNNNLSKEQMSKLLDCKFIRVDLSITLGEIEDSLSKKLLLFSIVIIIADLGAFVSILFGLLFVVNYKGPNEFEEVKSHERNNKSHSRDTKNKMDSSSENLRK